MVIQAVNFDLWEVLTVWLEKLKSEHIFFFLSYGENWQEKGFSLLLPLLFWSSRFTLTPQRFFTIVFTLNAHGPVSYRLPQPIWLLRLTRRERRSGLCHKYVQLYLHALCSWLWCAWGSCGSLLPQRTLCTKQGSFPSATPQSFKALVCVCSLITANQGKHTLQSGMTSIYTAVCKLFQCQNKDENKKSYAWNVLWFKIYILCKKLMLL